jgi:adenylate cyclase class IV
MIEVEVKYQVKTIPKYFSKTRPTKTIIQEDIYYDTAKYTLLKQGNFLRVRNLQTMEFKLNIGDDSHLYCQETSFKIKDLADNTDSINSALVGLGVCPSNISFATLDDLLSTARLTGLASIKKHRSVYQLPDATSVSLDVVDEPGIFIEAERMVDSSVGLQAEQIFEIGEELKSMLTNNLIISPSDKQVKIGYVELYLLKHNPKAYKLGKFKQ